MEALPSSNDTREEELWGGNAQCTYIYMKKILSQFPLNPLIMIRFSSQDIYTANNCNNVIFSIVMAYARTSMD